MPFERIHSNNEILDRVQGNIEQSFDDVESDVEELKQRPVPTPPTGPVATLRGERGPAGPAGRDGNDGQGIATGGDTGQVLTKKSNADFDTEWTEKGSWWRWWKLYL